MPDVYLHGRGARGAEAHVHRWVVDQPIGQLYETGRRVRGRRARGCRGGRVEDVPGVDGVRVRRVPRGVRCGRGRARVRVDLSVGGGSPDAARAGGEEKNRGVQFEAGRKGEGRVTLGGGRSSISSDCVLT